MPSVLQYDPSSVDRIGPVPSGDPTRHRPIVEEPLMTSILGQSRGTIVPGTDWNGVSLGYSPHQNSTLVISPGNVETGEDGIHIDTAKITPVLWNRALEQGKSIEDVYRLVAKFIAEEDAARAAQAELAEKRAAAAQQAVAASPVAAPVMAVPAAAPVMPVAQPLPVPVAAVAPAPPVSTYAAPMPAPAPAPAPAPVPTPAPVSPLAPAPTHATVTQPDPQLLQMRAMLADTMTGVTQLTAVVAQLAAVVAQPQPQSQPQPQPVAPVVSPELPSPPVVSPESAPKAAAAPPTSFAVEDEEMKDYLDTGYGPLPEKPKVHATFDLGPAGVMAARYHRVRREGNSLILEFDNRYDGAQYMPPPGSGNVEVTVQSDGDAVVYPVKQQPTLVRVGVIELLIFPLVRAVDRRREDADEHNPASPSPIPRRTLEEMMASPLPVGREYGKESSH